MCAFEQTDSFLTHINFDAPATPSAHRFYYVSVCVIVQHSDKYKKKKHLGTVGVQCSVL